MLASVIAFFFKRPALIGLGLMALVISVQTARLSLAHHEVKSAKAGLQIAQDGRKAAGGALDAENASVASLSAQSAQATDRAVKGQAAAKGQMADLSKSRARLAGYKPAGATLCARWEDADRVVKEALR
jgi:hypothetical protein